MAVTGAGQEEGAREGVLLVPRADAAARLERQLERGVDLRATPPTEARARKDDFEDWTDHTIELLRYLFDSDVEARRFCATSRVRDGKFRVDDYYWNSKEEFFDPLDARLRALRALEDRLRYIPEAPRADIRIPEVEPERDAGHVVALGPVPAVSRQVVVHGHDPDARTEVSQLLAALGLEPVELEGPITAAEAVERDAAEAAFAVVLLTPDDVGGPRQVAVGALRPRPRQDVLLELGLFCGQLGPRRVCGLYSGQVEIPSAFPGVAWIHRDPDGGWQLKLGKEMRAAGLAVDLNRL
jgi:predicted nucleotide-binding protein